MLGARDIFDYNTQINWLPLIYTVYNMTEYRDVSSVDMKFSTASVFDNGKLIGRKMISNNFDVFKFQGGKDVIVTSFNLYKYTYTDSIFHTESSYKRELLINSNFEYKFIPVPQEEGGYSIEYQFNYG